MLAKVKLATGTPRVQVGVELLSLGTLSSRVPRDDAIRALEQTEAQQAADFFRRHKVRTLADRKLAEIPTENASAVRSALSQSVRFISGRLQLVPMVIEQLDRAGRELDIAVVGIKGLAARQYYPDQAIREIGDWDVYVDSERAAWALAGWLRRRGFDYDEQELPWFKRDRENGRLYGQVRLGRLVNGVKVSVDVHFGGYSVRHCGLLQVRMPLDQPGWHLADRAQNLVMGVANAAGDQFITAKDLNDLMLALDDPTLDWTPIRAGISSAGLQGFFTRMLDRVHEIGDLSPEASDRAKAAAFRDSSEPLPPIWAQDDVLRRKVTVRHAYRLGRRHSLRRGAVAAMTASRYYRADLKVRVIRRRGRSTLPKASPWTCVRLVPVRLAARLGGLTASSSADASLHPRPTVVGRSELSANSSIQCVRTPSGDLVEAAGELFLPTVYYKVSANLTDAAVALGR